MYLFYTKFSLPTHGSASMHSDAGDSGYDSLLSSHIPSDSRDSGYDSLLSSPIPSGNGNSGYNCLLFSPTPSGNGNSGYDCLLFSHIPSDVKKGSACAVLPSSIPIINDSKTPIIQIPVVQNAPDHKQRTLEPPVLSSRTVGTYASVACRR